LTFAAENGSYALNCDQLWYQHNAILWAAGYCFHALRAVRAFGNAARGYDDVYELPLTDHDSQLISLLQRVENAKECSR
jgi:YARHG domain-containing protein